MTESWQIVVSEADCNSLILGVEQLRDDNRDTSATLSLVFDHRGIPFTARVISNRTGLGNYRLVALVTKAIADLLDKHCAMPEAKMLPTHLESLIEEKPIGFAIAPRSGYRAYDQPTTATPPVNDDDVRAAVEDA